MAEYIDDLIVLGMAVPEEIRDGRRTVCLGGYSPSRGFIRVYPCRPDMGLHRWNIIKVQVERNPRDTRHESWKFVDSNPQWETLNDKVEILRTLPASERYPLLKGLAAPCVRSINDERNSLGIVLASNVHRAYFGQNPQYGKPHQPALIERPGEQYVRTKDTYPIEPRLCYSCDECRNQHDQKVLEWGAFEWMRKNPGNVEQYWENARLFSTEHDLFILVGNQANQRTSFLVINIIPVKRGKKTEAIGARYAKQLSMFSDL